VIYSMSFCSIQ